MILRGLRVLFRRTVQNPTRTLPRPLTKNTRRFAFEPLESRVDACDLGPWSFDLDHGASLNDVYASEGWHESVINLTVPDECVASITWSVPSKPVIFKDYIHNHDEGRLVEFVAPAPGTKTYGIGFFWGPVDQNVSISATVTLNNGESLTKTATFDIDEPILRGSTVFVGTVGVLGAPFFGTPSLVLQNLPDKEGVEYEADVHSDHSGEFFFIQLVSVVATVELTDGTTCSRSTDGWRLDGGSDPEARYPDTLVHTDANGDAKPKLEDSPNAPLWHDNGTGTLFPARKLAEVFMAHIWLMYESDDDAPDGHRPVPVAHAEWGWSGTAVLKETSPGVYEDGNQPSDWEVRLPSSYANALVATDAWPEWQRDSYYQSPDGTVNYLWHCP